MDAIELNDTEMFGNLVSSTNVCNTSLAMSGQSANLVKERSAFSYNERIRCTKRGPIQLKPEDQKPKTLIHW